MRHKAVARTPMTSPSQHSAPTYNVRSDPTTTAALSYSERLALAAVGRGTSRASNDDAAARFRARRRDCGGGLWVPRGALDKGARRRQSKIRSRVSFKRGVHRVHLRRVFERHPTDHWHSFEHPSLTAPALPIPSRPRLIIDPRGAASASPTRFMRSVAAPRLNTPPFVVGVEHDDPAVVGSEKSETHGAHDPGSTFGYVSIPDSRS